MYCVARQRDDNAPHDQTTRPQDSRVHLWQKNTITNQRPGQRAISRGGGLGEQPTLTAKFIGQH